jgi:sugar (pentulose or hexulose) kinase
MTDPIVVVTLDIGGSAAKATAYDVSRHVNLATASTLYPLAPDLSDPGLFDPDAWWAAAVRSIRSVVGQVEAEDRNFLGITVSAVRMPFVLVDGSGSPTAPSILNRDRRALRQVGEIAGVISAERLYDVTGHWAAPEFGLPKLLWLRSSSPQAWRSTRTVLQLHDWFVFRLSGAIASEPSSAAMSQMLDVANGVWFEELLAAFEIPIGRFPELRPSGSRVGTLLADVASSTGLPSGLPVHVGGGDTHLSVLSASVGEEAAPVVVAGSTAPIQAATSSPPTSRERYPLLMSEHVLAGQWALESNAGPMGEYIGQLGSLGDLSGEPLKTALIRCGLTIEDHLDAPLTVLTGNPFFGPEGWSSTLAPTVIGLRDSHCGREVLAAAIDGSCYATWSILECLEGRLALRSSFVIATGGMSRSAIWCRQLAEVSGHEIRVRPLDQVAGLAGALLVAGSDAFAGAHVVDSKVYTPPTVVSPEHVQGCARYRELYQRLQLEMREHRQVSDACSH